MMPKCEILTGDCRDVLKSLPDESVNCCVTSPPYFGLRDYGHSGQIGLEQTPDAYVAEMVAVFREVRRVLRNDGTLWLNLGDSYAGSGRGAWNVSDEVKDAAGVKETYRPKVKAGSQLPAGLHESARQGGAVGRAWAKPPDGLKPKDLIGIPWMVAFALRADGWYLRSDIIWHKPNPMPESVTDRPTKSHEYLFLLSKSERYFYDADAIKEQSIHAGEGVSGSLSVSGPDEKLISQNAHRGRPYLVISDTRNKRTVWTVPTSPYKDAHFATYPPDLIKPCIMAGCPMGGTVLDPFGGSGTTGMVALQLGRSAVLIELNPEYAKLIEQRTYTTPAML